MSRFSPMSLLPPATRAVPGQYGACNGLRGVGALIVIFVHLELATDFNLIPHAEYFSVVVDMFFIFSGFIMTHAYEAKLSGGGSIGEFLIRRFARIWPLHAVTLLLLILWELTRYGLMTSGLAQLRSVPFISDSLNAADAILPNLFFLNAVGLTRHETWNFPSWSLGAEFWSYLAFAGLFIFNIKRRGLAAILIVICSLSVLAIFAPFGLRSTYDFGAVRCIASFFLGMLLQNLIAGGHIQKWCLPEWPLATLVEAGVLIGVSVFVIACVDTKAAILFPLALSAFVLVIAIERGALSFFLMTRPIQIFAEWSYSMYLVHALVLIGILNILHVSERHFGVTLFAPDMGSSGSREGRNFSGELIHFGHNIPAEIALIVIYMLIVIALAAVTYRYIEVPGRNFFNRFAKRYSQSQFAGSKASEAVKV